QRRRAQRPAVLAAATPATRTPVPTTIPAMAQWYAIRTSLTRTSYKSEEECESSALNRELWGNACRSVAFRSVSGRRFGEARKWGRGHTVITARAGRGRLAGGR